MTKFAVGFVLYKPNISTLEDTIDQFSDYSDEIVLFNNGISDSDLAYLRKCNRTIIGSGENIGIASALNGIMSYVKENFTADWVIVSDQDAKYSGNIINAYSKFTNDPNIGAICPQIVKTDNSQLFVLEDVFMEVERCPTSGMAMRVSDWLKVGKYDDDLFIDYVDYDMCEKILLNNQKIIRTKKVALIQNLGNSSRVKSVYLVGKLLRSSRIKKMATIFNHSPKRNYYFVRNSIIYLKKYGQYIDKRKECMFIFKWELKKLLFEEKKLRQLKAIRDGLKDGFRYKKSFERG